MQNLMNYAIAYAKKGLSVLPMANKKPLIKFRDREDLTVEEIKKIWQQHPYANIALKTTNFLVVDIDQHENGANGFETLKTVPDELLPETLSQTTKHGGRQLFYLKRADMNVKQLIGWQPGIDIKAHDNNYVIVAPSDGYKWENKNPIVTAPKSLITNINQMRVTKSNYSPSEDIKYTGERNSTTDLLELIATGLGGQGARNRNLTALTGAILFRNVSPKLAYRLVNITNENSVDPLPQNEVDRTFESVLERDLKNKERGMNVGS